MTYALIIVPFAVLTIIVTAASATRPRFGARMLASSIAAVLLIVLTAVFDNVMIGAGLVGYPPENLSGLRIGIAPLEDFSYSLCAAFLLPSVYVLLSPKDPR